MDRNRERETEAKRSNHTIRRKKPDKKMKQYMNCPVRTRDWKAGSVAG